VCSTLRCESEHFSSAADCVIDDPHQIPSGVFTEVSINSDQRPSSSLGVSSNSHRSLQSGYTSPSSLALQRRLPEAPVYLKQHTLSTDSTTASTDNSTGACSSTTSSSSYRINSKTAIARAATPSNNNPSQRGAPEFENRLDIFRISTQAEVDIKNRRIEEKTTRQQEDCPEAEFKQFCLNPPSLRSKAWSEPSAEAYQVRSKDYMTNRIKEPSKKCAFRLITIDLINSKTPIYSGMCAHPGERIQLALERERKTGIRELPEFVFAVNLCIPAQTIYHAVFYYGIDKNTMEKIRSGQTAFGRIMKQFIFGNSDSYRNKTFKLIPRVVEGNYLVRKGVGSKPTILGKKIKQRYVRGGGVSGQDDDRYFEIIVDLASDPIAKQITKLCLGYIKTIVVEMMFALEGYDESTLPERIFGGATIKNIDFTRMDGKRSVR